MGLYYCLDFIITLTDGIGLAVLGRCFLKPPRFSLKVCDCIISISVLLIAWGLTWFSEMGAYKMPLLFAFYVFLYKICYRDSVYQAITAIELFYTALVVLPENISTILATGLYGDAMIISVEGNSIGCWEVYVMTLFFRIFTAWFAYMAVKNFQYKIKREDSLVLTFLFLSTMTFYWISTFNYLNLSKNSNLMIEIGSSGFSVAFFIIFLYSKNVSYLREQARQKQITIDQMNRQFAYYREKLRDEERVRSVYHDMKNHLLVLQRQIDSKETENMVKNLQSQIEMYEDYVHTGSDILDIILKEKTALAKEKQTVLSVAADLGDMNFIEPLDISTIFGNGLDNAIEASEKLSPDKRVILVKAGKLRDFFSVLIENNCVQEHVSTKSRAAKQDNFLHGFGLSNMRQAVEKYDGQLTTKCENGKFTLKILIPIP